jgi:hypothetical protein
LNVDDFAENAGWVVLLVALKLFALKEVHT